MAKALAETKLTVVDKLGEGAFGEVFKCKTDDGKEVVIKRFFITRGNANVGIINIKELDIVCSFNKQHPYLVHATNIYIGSHPFTKDVKYPEKVNRVDKLYIEMPLAKMDLLSLIQRGKRPVYSYHKRMMYQIISGLYFLHSHNVAHRDVKPNNILCYFPNNKPVAKLTDFGMSRILKKGDRNSVRIGTNMYNAPEMTVPNSLIGTKADIWSAAACFMEMITGKTILDGDETNDKRFSKVSAVMGPPSEELLKKLTQGRVSYAHIIDDKQVPRTSIKSFFSEIDIPLFEKSSSGGIDNPGTLDEFIDLLTNMFEIDPEKRYDAWQCLQHPFFSNVKEDGEYLILQKEIKIIEEPYGNPHWNKSSLSVFRTIKTYNMLNEENMIRMHSLFIALDLFHRVSYKLKTTKGDIQKYLLKKQPQCIASVCIYIAHKLRFHEKSPSYDTTFNFLQVGDTKITSDMVFKIETKILKLVDYRISRVTIYDKLPSDNVLIDTVFEYMLSDTEYYHYTISELAISIMESQKSKADTST